MLKYLFLNLKFVKKYKILVADDHAMIRDGIKALLSLNKELIVVGEAMDGVEAIEKFKKLEPDLLILDISMPNLSGMDAAQKILESNPAAKILMLSMYNDEDYISRCMELGVQGYVIKSETSNELEYAVKTILKGQNYFSAQVQHVIFNKYSITVQKRNKKDPELKLTERELEIIKLISIGLTSQQIADQLFISPRTVDTHRANLMKKAGVKNSIELVKKLEKLELL